MGSKKRQEIGKSIVKEIARQEAENALRKMTVGEAAAYVLEHADVRSVNDLSEAVWFLIQHHNLRNDEDNQIEDIEDDTYDINVELVKELPAVDEDLDVRQNEVMEQYYTDFRKYYLENEDNIYQGINYLTTCGLLLLMDARKKNYQIEQGQRLMIKSFFRYYNTLYYEEKKNKGYY